MRDLGNTQQENQMKMRQTKRALPGALGVNVLLIVAGLVFSGCGLVDAEKQGVVASLLVGLGGGFFVAGFVGFISTFILAEELHKVATLPFEDVCLLSQVRGSGLDAIARDRTTASDRVLDSMERETKEVVIVGSSLKGFIGVGATAVGPEQRVRQAILDALKNGSDLNVLMTNPAIAHHRSGQEGRRDGDIEAEILENLIYFLGLRKANPEFAARINVKVYDGTPTIFMVCTSDTMLLNPYPYYSTAFSSFAMIIRGGTDLYRTYYSAHYREAWKDNDLTKLVTDEQNLAVATIKEFITGDNEHHRAIIPDETRRHSLLEKLHKAT